MKKKIVQPVFFDENDEQLLVDQIHERYSDLAIVDGAIWPTAIPPEKKLVTECHNSILLFWRRGFPENLPVLFDNGRYEGPQTKFVVRLIRSKMKDGVLRSGQLDVSYDTEDQFFHEFASTIFKIANSFKPVKLVQLPELTEAKAYLVGPSAASFSFEGGILKHLSADFSYRAISNILK